MEKGISVIICCYNSAKLLPQTLKHIAGQIRLEQVKWEVLIIDNNSSDNTVETVKNEVGKNSYTFDFKIISEPKQGLSHARKAGIKNAQYSYLLFCDDDNWLEQNYLRNAFDIMEANPNIGVLGGKNLATSDVEFPDWFEAVKHNYAVGQQADKSGDITKKGYVWGAGSVYRKNVLQSIIDMRIETLLTDRKGTELSSGGDSEMCQWNIMLGLKLWYDDSLVLQHFIPQNRLTKEYYERLLQGFDKMSEILTLYYNYINNYLDVPSETKCLKYILKLFYYNLIGKKDRNKYLFDRLKLYYDAKFNSKTNLFKVLSIAKKLNRIKTKIIIF